MRGSLFCYLISSIGLIVLGLILKYFDWKGAHPLLVLGLLAVVIRSIKYLIRGFEKGTVSRLNLILHGLMALMSIILFTRYLYWTFGDYPTLIVVPLFIVCSIWYFRKSEQKDLGLSASVILYLILCIPLFAFDFYSAPRKYIPEDWYDRLGNVTSGTVNLPHGFKTAEAEELSVLAFNLRSNGQVDEAIQAYARAIEIEPENPRLLFDLSVCLGETNELESAISALDIAIKHDGTCPAFYLNRGLFHYKLKHDTEAILDFEKVIALDSNMYEPYVNLALTYHWIDDYDKACAAISNGESRGMPTNSLQEIQRIKARYCK